MKITIDITDDEAATLRYHAGTFAWSSGERPEWTLAMRVIDALPRPIGVGDTVRCHPLTGTGVVLAIDDGHAWLRFSDSYGTARLERLTRVEKP